LLRKEKKIMSVCYYSTIPTLKTTPTMLTPVVVGIIGFMLRCLLQLVSTTETSQGFTSLRVNIWHYKEFELVIFDRTYHYWLKYYNYSPYIVAIMSCSKCKCCVNMLLTSSMDKHCETTVLKKMSDTKKWWKYCL
jgi:hypothetical protein